MERAELLARCSDEPGRITRLYGTPAHASASDALAGWMSAAGMSVRARRGRQPDRARRGRAARRAGAYARLPLRQRPRRRALGRDARRARGDRGRRADQRGRATPRAAARDRGLRGRGGHPLRDRLPRQLGAQPAASTPPSSTRVDAAGVSLEDAIRDSGGDPAGLGAAARAPGSLAGYVEVHIEQGPVLDDSDVALGVVTAIAGQTRAALRFGGVPGHAGNGPDGAPPRRALRRRGGGAGGGGTRARGAARSSRQSAGSRWRRARRT